jgi:hypothetical protein
MSKQTGPCNFLSEWGMNKDGTRESDLIAFSAANSIAVVTSGEDGATANDEETVRPSV